MGAIPRSPYLHTLCIAEKFLLGVSVGSFLVRRSIGSYSQQRFEKVQVIFGFVVVEGAQHGLTLNESLR